MAGWQWVAAPKINKEHHAYEHNQRMQAIFTE